MTEPGEDERRRSSRAGRAGRIAVRDVEFQAKHGATADERRTSRRFQVDVEIEMDVAAAVASDRVRDAVDYYEVCRIVVEIGTGRTYHLLEALAGALVEGLAKRWPAAKITVELRKLNPPCPGNPSVASVRLSSN